MQWDETRFYFVDDAATLRLFSELPQAAQERVIKPLMGKAIEIVVEAEREEAPTESGLLAKALGASKLREYSQGGTLYVTSGVRRGFRRAVTMMRSGGLRVRSRAYTEANPNAAVRDPVRYLHLVVGGRKALSVSKASVLYDAATGQFFGTHVAAAPADPFMDRAFERAKESAADAILAGAEVGIAEEAQRLGAKP
jgi:hypothetical protein